MSGPDEIDSVTCPSCGEANEASRSACWLCGDLVARSTSPGTAAGMVPSPAGEIRHGSLASVLLPAAVVLVALGAAVEFEGLGIVLAIVAAIPALRTLLVTRARMSRGAPVTRLRVIRLFLTSLAVTWTLLAIVGLAALGALYVVCTSMSRQMGQSGSRRGALPPELVVVALIVGVLSIPLVAIWIVRRYRKDKNAP